MQQSPLESIFVQLRLEDPFALFMVVNLSRVSHYAVPWYTSEKKTIVEQFVSAADDSL
jgi:hypothetical protein